MAAASTVLVVYDSRAIRETVTVLGIENEYNVVELDDVAHIEERVEEANPVLVLVCAMSRKTAAYETCRAVKAAAGETFLPVLVYALRADDEERRKAFEAGADDLVQVTISPEQLLYRVRSLLRVREMVMESQRRTRQIAQASAEAADMMLQLEEADRRIREQNVELERMVRELEERDRRISAQQAEIQAHLATLQKEMELASALQLNLLPSAPPEVPGLALFDRYVPAAELCGDYYDYAAMPDGLFHISIADVTGHGVAPALVSVQVRALAQAALEETADPAQVLERLNAFMVETFRQDYLMTMLALTYDPSAGAVAYAGAGHCPMILLSAAGDACTELPSQGMPLGISAGARFSSDSVQLKPGDKLLLYTDGITETPGEDRKDIFGVERLLDAFRGCAGAGGREALEAVFRRARTHAAGGAFEDDVTLVLLERLSDSDAPPVSDRQTG